MRAEDRFPQPIGGGVTAGSCAFVVVTTACRVILASLAFQLSRIILNETASDYGLVES